MTVCLVVVAIAALYLWREAQMQQQYMEREAAIQQLELRYDSLEARSRAQDSVLLWQARYNISAHRYFVERWGESPLADAYWRQMNAVATFRADYSPDSTLPMSAASIR